MDTKLMHPFGEKGTQYFNCFLPTATQSLYSLVNNIFPINNSYIFCAISLKNDIDFTVNDTYHEVNEVKIER